MTKREVEEYKAFMYNAKNEHNCKECPMNEGHNNAETNYKPCGQQICWVTCHCKEES